LACCSTDLDRSALFFPSLVLVWWGFLPTLVLGVLPLNTRDHLLIQSSNRERDRCTSEAQSALLLSLCIL
jgi:hypothetical protein